MLDTSTSILCISYGVSSKLKVCFGGESSIFFYRLRRPSSLSEKSGFAGERTDSMFRLIVSSFLDRVPLDIWISLGAYRQPISRRASYDNSESAMSLSLRSSISRIQFSFTISEAFWKPLPPNFLF